MEAGLDSVEARLNIVPAVASGSRGGLTCGGIVPTAVRIGAPGPPWLFTAVKNVAFMPPATPIFTRAAGVPRVVSSAVLISSRRLLMLASGAVSSGGLLAG